MKLLMVFALLCLALSEADNCAQRKSYKCVKDLNIYYKEHITEEEHDRELIDVYNCFKSALAECVNEEPDELIKEIVKILDIHLKEKGYEALSEADKCAQRKSHKCVKDLNIYYKEHITEEEHDRELIDVHDCFKSALAECENEKPDELIQEIIRILDIHLKEKGYEALSVANNCTQRKSHKCINDLNITDNVHITEEEYCRELFNVSNCYKSALAECVNDESDEEIREDIKNLDIYLKENCYEVNVGNEVEEKFNSIKQCLGDNVYYIAECIEESTTKIVPVIIKSNEQPSDDTLKCTIYREMAQCYVERIGEKCGEDAEDAARKEMEEVPVEIVESCKAANLT